MSVQIDAHVVLQVCGHLNAAFPASAGGILLGTGAAERENDQIVHVTESFALPHHFIDTGSVNLSNNEVSKYTEAMISKLNQVGSDKHIEGWYLSSSVGAVYDAAVFDNMYTFQKANPSSVLLVNDVALNKSTKTLNLRAFRLSEQYLKLRATADSSSASSSMKHKRVSTEMLLENKVDYTNLLDELHVAMLNPALVSKFVCQYLADHPTTASVVSGSLLVPNQNLLETRGEVAMDTIDDLNYEQGNYNYYQRQLVREKQKIAAWQLKRKNDNVQCIERGEKLLPHDEWKTLFTPIEEPCRLENLLLSAQLEEHCNELEELAGTTGSTLMPTKFA